MVVELFISLLSLLVGHDRHAIIDLRLKSLGFGISMNSDFCISTAVLISSNF